MSALALLMEMGLTRAEKTLARVGIELTTFGLDLRRSTDFSIEISHSLSNPEPFQMPHCLFILSLTPLFACLKYQHPFNRLSFFIISPMRNPQLFQVIKVEVLFCNGERFGFKSPPFL